MLTLDFRFASGRISALGWRSRACLLGMASTAIFAKAAIGQERAAVAAAGQALHDLLSGAESSFAAPWERLLLFAAARDFPMRHASILQPFEAAARAWEDLKELAPH